jgi:putative aldouronate transport system permease protein
MLEKRKNRVDAFDVINKLILGVISLVMVLPLVQIIIASFTAPELLLKNEFILFPTDWSLDAYRYIFSSSVVIRSMVVSVCVVIVGTTFRILLQVLMAYPLAHKTLKGRRVITFLVTFTLMFSGGMVPTYIIVQKLHLINSYASLILPGAMTAFSVIIFKSFFQQIPAELEESAKMDRCNDLTILFRIILPVSKPLIATFMVLFGVAYWNSWFDALLYLNKAKMWPIQLVLRLVISSTTQIGDMTGSSATILPKTVQMCTIVMATLPILCVYPFVQKYFEKGILLGSVKG